MIPILHCIPVCPKGAGNPRYRGRDLGFAYNQIMDIVPPGWWVAFMDGDAWHTTKEYWFRLIQDAVEKKPDAGAFIATTNRLIRDLSGFQMTPESEVPDSEQNIDRHWAIGDCRAQRHGAALEDVTRPDHINPRYKFFSGVWFCVNKQTWQKIGGAPPGHKMVDWQLHQRICNAGLRIYLLPGLYVYHRYHFGDPRWGRRR